MTFATLDEALGRLARGELLIVVDDEDRENEGDLVCAAELVTPEAVNFMIRLGRGLVTMPCDARRLEALGIGAMVPVNTCPMGTAFTVSIDHRDVASGISARDRALTIRHVTDPSARPGDFVRPGHVFPLRARPGGVLERPGHTEASVELALLAGLRPCAVLCEVLDDHGEAAPRAYLHELAAGHGVAMLSIRQLIEHVEAQAEPLASASAGS